MLIITDKIVQEGGSSAWQTKEIDKIIGGIILCRLCALTTQSEGVTFSKDVPKES